MPATRLDWSDLPSAVVARIESALGSRVVRTSSQTTGFSPGLADRVVAADGSRAFVKAVSRSFAAESHRLYTREASVLRSLPPSVRAPRLITAIEVDDWVALVIDEVAGAHPSIPPTDDQLTAVLDAVAAAPEATFMPLPRASDLLIDGFTLWPALLAAGSGPGWVIADGPAITALAASAAQAVDGTRLVHLDLRSDNVLLGDDGAAWIVDWPWAAVGAPWLDGLMMLLDARMHGGRPERLLRTHPLFDSVDDDDIDAVLAGLAGLFLDGSLRPPPPNLPSLREFQAREAAAALDWLRERRFSAAH